MKLSALAEQQWHEAKGQSSVVRCRCGALFPLRFMYRCYYCLEYLCEDCAAEHFGATREEYQAKKMEQENVPDGWDEK